MTPFGLSMGAPLKALRSVLPALWLAGLTCHAAAPPSPPVLNVCLNDDDAPFSTAATPDQGIDVEVAQALARRLGRPLRLVWVQVPNRGGLGKALRQSLVAGGCDAYLGVPQGPDMAKDLVERKLVASGAYLTLGYVLVANTGAAVPSPATMRRARKIGAGSATPADLYLHRMQMPRSPYPGTAALIAGLQAGEIDLALIWSPALAGPVATTLVRATEWIDDADLYTGLTVATRSADTALSADIAGAIDALRADGQLDGIAERNRLPRITRR